MVAVLVTLILAAAGNRWCAGPKTQQWAEGYRGVYQDFSLYVGSRKGCVEFADHGDGNDGLWVLEYDWAEEMAVAEEVLAGKKAMDVVHKQNRSLVVRGMGLPAAMGYDACGTERGKRVISVPPHDLPKPQAALHLTTPVSADARVAEALAMIDIDMVASNVEHLQSYHSRNSNIGSNLEIAAEWAVAQYKRYGFNVTRHEYDRKYYPQVIAERKGMGADPKVVVIGAHLDSRSTRVNDPTQRAPGADDNGSGSAAMVTVAQIIHESNIPLTHTIRILSFTGEEQGLFGSRAIAKQWKDEGLEVLGMLNADMIGYRIPNTAPTLGYVDRFVDPLFMAWSVVVTELYVPDLKIAFSNTCCSDHQSFLEEGFRSLSFFENNAQYSTYPEYHTSSDLLQYLDKENLQLHTRALLASTLVLAEPMN